MHNSPSENLSKYRIDRADELIVDAEELFNNDSYKSSNNRAYYAIFYAMRAVLALDEQDFKKHSGVIQYFQREYIKTGIFEKQYSEIITKASIIRNASDYDDFYTASKDEAATQIENAKNFIKVVKEYLESKLDSDSTAEK